MGKRMLVIMPMLLATIGMYAQDADTTQTGEMVQLKTIVPYSYAAIEMRGSYEQHEQAFGALYQAAGVQGIMLSDYPSGIYYNGPANAQEDSLRWEIGVAVTDVDSVAAPLILKKYPYTSLASLIYEGAYDEGLQSAIGQIFSWISKNGYREAGPLQEIYLSMPTRNESGNWIGQIEILVPVQNAE
ncbi:GyrI-like domain-containing protein [bacterium]|nr:GyrI-like domain-containing protein [bacterium]